jgi:hypothetical protein
MKTQLLGLSILLTLTTNAPVHAGRLFATSSTVGLGLIEIDPQSGSVLNVLQDHPRAVWDGLAFDGTHLWFLGLDRDTIFKLDADNGATIDSYALTPSSNFRSGLAYLNGLLYTLDYEAANQDITVFDPSVGAIVGSLDFNGVNSAPPLLLERGLSGITGPDALLVGTGFTSELLEIDPTSGLITNRLQHAQSPALMGAAVVDGEIYLSTHTSPDIYVYNRSGSHLRTITVPGANGLQSLAGDDTANVPEPSTACLLLSGLLLRLGRRRSRRRPR